MNTEYKKYLFQPFEYIAGSKALLAGLLIIILTGVVSFFTGVRFNGVIDMHLGNSGTLIQHILEGLIDWLALSLFLCLAAMMLRKNNFRPLDIFGTVALSRWPMLVVSGLAGFINVDRINGYFEGYYLKKESTITLQWFEMPVFIVFIIIALLFSILMISLFYKAYSISCNIKGPRSIWSFIIALLLAEAASGIIINECF